MWSTRGKEILIKLEPLAEGMGLKIVEMDLPNGQNGIFRVYVDSLEEGKKVTVDECAKFSPLISDYLDTFDPFPFRYYLEVSSPGLDRPLRRWDEMARFIGKKIRVVLREKLDNRRKFTGVLMDVDDEHNLFTIKENGKDFKIGREMVKRINIVWEGDK